MSFTFTHTYTTLEIPDAAFDSILRKITKIGPDYVKMYVEKRNRLGNATCILFPGSEVALAPTRASKKTNIKAPAPKKKRKWKPLKLDVEAFLKM